MVALVLVSAVLFPMLHYYWTRQAWGVQLVASLRGQTSSLVDKAMRIVFPVLFLLQVGYKSMNGRLVFMFQPCHALTLALVYLSWSKPGSRTAGWVFNLYLHSVYAPWLAIFRPGTCRLRSLLHHGSWQVHGYHAYGSRCA